MTDYNKELCELGDSLKKDKWELLKKVKNPKINKKTLMDKIKVLDYFIDMVHTTLFANITLEARKLVDCPKCNGNGYVEDVAFWNPFSLFRTKTCPLCNGMKKVQLAIGEEKEKQEPQ